LILKHLRNISDVGIHPFGKSVVEQYSENVYYQYLCGQSEFVAKVHCLASELVHFRNRIGEQGVELILKESIRINGDDRFDPDVSIDTTVQEKNITIQQIINYIERSLQNVKPYRRKKIYRYDRVTAGH
jgi:IS5 family transposase